MSAETILSRLHDNLRIRPDKPAYYAKANGEWQPTTWREYVGQVRQATRALMALGLNAGDTVSILGFNRPEWVIFDLACMLAGGAPAGIYTTNAPNEVSYIINHAESEVVLVENEMQWKKVEEELDNLPTLNYVVMMKDAQVPDHPKVLSWEAFMAKGEGIPEQKVDDSLAALEPDQRATFIYTSGTTGPPKAVMLSHQNLLWTAQTVGVEMFGTGEGDCTVSYLPLSHIAEQMFTIHGAICGGFSVYFAESIDKLPDNLKEVQPTIVFGVPRIWEKFHAGVTEKLKESTGIKAKLVQWAMSVGRRMVDAGNKGETPGGFLKFQYNLANKLIYSKVKPALGLGRARVCISSAAPVAAEILEFFSGLDVTIREVYGQSEGSGPTTVSTPGKTRFGAVGSTIPGTEVKTLEDGEIVLKGPNVFLGYYKDEAATKDTLIDGWLQTGDLGEFDDTGLLTITGRKKDIIITSGGKNIAPKNIESALTNLELVAQSIVIGDARKYLSALLTLEETAIARFATEHNLPTENLHENPKVIAEIQKGVDEVNKLFARVENIRKFKILPRNFTVEDGELTPTLKLKRRIVNENFADAIESLYNN